MHHPSTSVRSFGSIPVDLISGEDGEACVSRICKDPNPDAIDLETYAAWARHCIKVFYAACAIV